jgi:hypothetical protein
MRFGLLCTAAVLFSVASTGVAATTIGSLNPPSQNTSSGHQFFGQSFTVPAGETGLQSASLQIQNFGATNQNALFQLWVYDASQSPNPLVAPIAIYPRVVSPGFNQTYTQAFNEAVTPGSTYAIFLSFDAPGLNVGSYYSATDYYAGGSTFFESQSTPLVFAGFDQAFEVKFGAIPEPASVAVIGAVGAIALRRRK